MKHPAPKPRRYPETWEGDKQKAITAKTQGVMLAIGILNSEPRSALK